MSFRVTEVQQTPNPNALKFLLDRPITEQPMSFFNAGAAEGHLLAQKFFAIAGVSRLLLLGDFVTVNKDPSAKWATITPKVKALLAKHV